MAETSNTSLESNASDRSETSPFEAFGPNSGLVEEMYRQYLQNPNSVGDGWAEFFADYTPRSQRDSRADLTIGTPQTTPAPTSTSSVMPGQSGNHQAPTVLEGETAEPLRGVAAKIVENMAASIGVPTATSMRAMPTKLM